MKRALCAGLFFVAVTAFPAGAIGERGWTVIGRDPHHSSSLSLGPEAPLKRDWTARTDDSETNFTTWPVTLDGTVYARSAGGLLAIEGRSGRRVFWHDGGGSRQVSPSLDEERVYLPLGLDPLRALDRETGAPVWAYSDGDVGAVDPSSTLSDGRIFFSLPDSKAIYALDTATGRLIWKVETELSPDYVSAVSDGVLVTLLEDVNSREVKIIALDPSTGQQIWEAPQKESASSPSILGGKVIIGGGDDFAHALDLKTGKPIWKSPVEDKFSPRNMPALAFGDVFLADRVGNIYRLDGETGKRKWIFRDTRGTMDQSFPVIAGTTLFIGSGSGDLYAIDTDDGKLLWTGSVRGIVLSGAADEERWYFGVKNGPDEGLYAYEHDPKGKLESTRPAGTPLTALLGGLALFALLVIGVVAYFRRSRGRQS